MFGFVKVFTMHGLQLKKTGKLLIKDFVTPILRKIFTFISTLILGKQSEKCRKR